MGSELQNPVANPLPGPVLDGTEITVDALLNPPTVIPERIRALVAQNEGYFAEEIFATPGFTVQGGAIIYTESFPEDHFLPDDQSLAPRAPGAEAPLLGSTRRAPKVARPESLSGAIEVHDEARRRNDVITIRRQFTQTANTFADQMQSRAIETLLEFVETAGRQVTGINWRQARPNGTPNADPLTMPARDIALVIKQFVNDKAGVRPDRVGLNPEDYFFLEVLYPDGKLKALFDAYNLTPLVSPQIPEGEPLFWKAEQPGVIAFEQPLNQEQNRIPRRKTDEYTLEAVPVFVAYDASAVLQLQGVSHS